MKNVLLKLERFVPFLSLPRLSLPGRSRGNRQRRVSADRLEPGADLSHLVVKKTIVQNRGMDGMTLHQVGLRGLTFDTVDFSNTLFSHCTLEDVKTTSSRFENTRWRIVAADRSEWRHCRFTTTSWVGVSCREATFEDCDLDGAEILMCDAFATRLHDVHAAGAVFRAVDLSYASFDNVDFSGADLRGCRFARGTWHRVTLQGTRVEGADFRGVRGLPRDLRLDLWQRGALVWSGWTERAAWHILPRLFPGWSPETLDRASRALTVAVRTLVAVLLALSLALGMRTGCLSPPPHDTDTAFPEGAAWRKRTATQEEIEKTKENLKRLRAAIARAYQTTAKYGIARYPTGAELAGNRYDKDGDGPGTETVELVPGGLPKNFLTDGEGVAPYCNEVPTQDTLSGDDTDWHYCEATGRVFACGGYTDLPTIEW